MIHLDYSRINAPDDIAVFSLHAMWSSGRSMFGPCTIATGLDRRIIALSDGDLPAEPRFVFNGGTRTVALGEGNEPAGRRAAGTHGTVDSGIVGE
jgi:hypothetical protein